MTVRDSRRQRLYDAEREAARQYGPPMYGQTIPNSELQRKVDEALATRAVRARWPKASIQVVLTHGNGGAHAYPMWPGRSGTIHLSRDGRNPWVLVHEIAHILAPDNVAGHGPEYCGVYLFLVGVLLGPDHRKALHAALRAHRAPYNLKGVPAPRQVPSLTQIAASRRAAATRPITTAERTRLADDIRRAVKAGVFGEPGRKPRDHALATARLLAPAEARAARRG